jgi:hypothetical protein
VLIFDLVFVIVGLEVVAGFRAAGGYRLRIPEDRRLFVRLFDGVY